MGSLGSLHAPNTAGEEHFPIGFGRAFAFLLFLLAPYVDRHALAPQVGANYGTGINPYAECVKEGYSQILWLLPADEDYIMTEVRGRLVSMELAVGRARYRDQTVRGVRQGRQCEMLGSFQREGGCIMTKARGPSFYGVSELNFGRASSLPACRSAR